MTTAARRKHATPETRAAAGKAARAACPRSSHAAWEAPPDRPRPLDTLQAETAARLPDLVPIRYGRMLESPLSFYRGGAGLMAADLARTPNSGIEVQLCGDAHLGNFGIYAAPNRTLVFDVNDFDETLAGPWEWDVKRLATSFEIATRERGFVDAERERVVLASVQAYHRAMAGFSLEPNLQVWYAHLDTSELFERLRADATKTQGKLLERTADKARGKDSLAALAKLTHLVDGEPHFLSDPPLLVPAAEVPGIRDDYHETIHDFIENYRTSLPDDRRHLLSRYHYVDLARKVVGVGSVGMRVWVALLVGRDNDDPLFLQLKQADASVLEPFVGASVYRNHGQRVVEGQRLMQAASDIMLGWYRMAGLDGTTHDLYVRQLWDGKASLDVTTMSAAALRIYAQVCGWTLARAHARSGDSIAIAAYLGRGPAFDRSIAAFASAYADQNQRDFESIAEAAKLGQVTVERDL